MVSKAAHMVIVTETMETLPAQPEKLAQALSRRSGAEPGQSLPSNLAREVFEETGLTVSVGAPVLVNEFHDPQDDFHQVDIFFRCDITNGELTDAWKDPENVVSRRRFFARDELRDIAFKPDILGDVAWAGPSRAGLYDPLERLLR